MHTSRNQHQDHVRFCCSDVVCQDEFKCRERNADLQLAAELLDHAVAMQHHSSAHLQAFQHKETEQQASHIAI